MLQNFKSEAKKNAVKRFDKLSPSMINFDQFAVESFDQMSLKMVKEGQVAVSYHPGCST